MNGDKNNGFHTVRGYQLINQQSMQLTPAMEDYLEMIYRLCLEVPYTRIGRLAEALHVQPSSASKMVMKLSKHGFVNSDRYEVILLTQKGSDTGAYFMYRHQIIASFLQLIGKRACLEETELIEHVVDSETVNLLKRLMTFIEQNPQIKKEWEKYRKVFAPDPNDPKCIKRSETYSNHAIE